MTATLRMCLVLICHRRGLPKVIQMRLQRDPHELCYKTHLNKQNAPTKHFNPYSIDVNKLIEVEN